MRRSIAVSSPRGERRGIRGRLLATLTTSLLTLGLAVLVACAGPGDGGMVTGDRDLLELVPGDASLVFWTDFAGIRSLAPEEGSPFPFLHGKPGTRFPGDLDREEIAELRRKTGIDLHGDVKQVALGFVADVTEGKIEGGNPISALRLDYDAEKLATYLEGQPTLEVRGHTLHRLPPEDVHEIFEEDDDTSDDGEEESTEDQESEGEKPGDREVDDREPGGEADDGDAADRPHARKPLYLVMLDREILLVGSEAAIRRSLDLTAGEGESVTTAPGIGDLLSRLPTERQALVAFGGAALSQGLREGVPDRSPVPKKALANLRSVGLTGHVSADRITTVTAVGLNDSADNAKLLKESVQGMVALGKMMLQQQEPELLEIVDRAVTVEQDDAEVRLRVRLTEEDGETLRRFAAERLGKPLPDQEEAGGEDESETG